MALILPRWRQPSRMHDRTRERTGDRKEARSMSRSWDKKVVVVLHHVPDSEDFDGGYEAVTMTRGQ